LGAASLCDLRSLVGERHFEGRREPYESVVRDDAQRDPAPALPMPADKACTRELDESPPTPRSSRPAGTDGRDEGRDEAEAGNTVLSGTKSTNSLEDSGDDPFASTRPEPAGNDTAYRPELALQGPARPDATAPSAWTGNPAPDPDPREMGATRAALEASLMNPVSTPEARAAAAWEVSLPLASGSAIELHATRPQTSAGASAWNLGIRTSARDLTSALARTASCLSDRLEARSVPAHVRIERDDREGEP
jgi:hypothetical protein